MKTYITALLMLISCTIFSQTTITLQPASEEGKDGLIDSRLPNGNTGGGDIPDLNAVAWTNGGVETIQRGLFEFNLSSIPAFSTINSAYLSLYNNPTSTSFNGQHSSISGSNQSVLQRITSSWDENTVNWNNKPSSTTQNQVFLPQSTSINQDFTNIDVTSLVQDMIDNPTTSFGFLHKLQTEQYYRCIILASSDHSDYSKHPKLVITYTHIIGIQDNENLCDFAKIFPNPTNELLLVKFSNNLNKELNITINNVDGKTVYCSKIKSTSGLPYKIHLNDFPAGLYFIRMNSDDFIKSEKLIIY